MTLSTTLSTAALVLVSSSWANASSVVSMDSVERNLVGRAHETVDRLGSDATSGAFSEVVEATKIKPNKDATATASQMSDVFSDEFGCQLAAVLEGNQLEARAATITRMAFASIPEILDDLRAGKIIVLVDDENRENEGDFVVAAEFVTAETVNFFARVGGGYLCVAIDGDSCDRLDLPPQGMVNTSLHQTPFTISVDGHSKHGVTTGISSSDRAKTIQLLADPNSTPDEFVRPGHINPLRARAGGVLVRTGQTEGSVDLCRLAGLQTAAAIIEIVKPDGEMARLPDLERLCAEHGLTMCSVEQIIEYRLARERLITRMEPTSGQTIETPEGSFTLIAWRSSIDALPHIALCAGGVGDLDENGVPIASDEPTLVRVHRRDLLGDIFGVRGDDREEPSRDSLRRSLALIHNAGRGALVYMRPESGNLEITTSLQQISRVADDVNQPDLSRPEGIGGKAMPMDQRELGIGSQILRDLGISKLKLISNNPRPWPTLHGFGLEVLEHVPLSS